MISKSSIKDWETTEQTDKSVRYSVDFSKAKVQLFEFKKGYKVPLHSHDGEALHIITKGKIKLHTGEIIEGISQYKCGGWEYTAIVMEDTQMIVVEN